MSRARSRFHPRLVPEIRNGYYWIAKDAVGLGTTSFKVPEGNKHPTFDLIQATVASQPTALTENGGVQFRMRKAADAAPSILKTTGDVVAGWNGDTYVAGWFRLPDAAGAVTGNMSLFQHTKASNIRFNINPGVVAYACTVTSNGTTSTTCTALSPFTGNWQWLEWLYVAAGATDTDRLVPLANLVQIARTGGAGTIPATLFNGAAPLGVACRAQNGLANVDTTDWAACYYGNGIPSLKNRKRLANYLAPVNTKFAI